MADGYLTLIKELLTACPNDPAVQRLAVACAELQSTPQRTELLKLVTEADTLDLGVREQLANDRTDAVRAAVWKRDDWDATALAAALDGDFSAPTRRSVIRNSACTPDLLVRAATPLLKSMAEPVLDRVDIAPGDLLLAATRLVLTQTTASLSKERLTRFQQVATQPTVAKALATDPDTPVLMRVFTLACTDLTDEEFLTATALLPSRVDVPGVHNRELGNYLENTLDRFHGRSVECVYALIDTYRKWVGQTSGLLPGKVKWAQLDAREQLRERTRNVWNEDAVLAAITSLPPGQYPADLAEEILRGRCGPAVLEALLPSLPDANLDALVDRYMTHLDDEGPRRWMIDFPELFLRYAEHARPDRAAGAPYIAAEKDDLLQDLFRLLCEAPERFQPGARAQMLQRMELPAEDLVRAPWGDLTAAIRGTATATAEQRKRLAEAAAAALQVMDTTDRDLAVKRAQLLATLLDAPAPPAAVVTAALTLEA